MCQDPLTTWCVYDIIIKHTLGEIMNTPKPMILLSILSISLSLGAMGYAHHAHQQQRDLETALQQTKAVVESNKKLKQQLDKANARITLLERHIPSQTRQIDPKAAANGPPQMAGKTTQQPLSTIEQKLAAKLNARLDRRLDQLSKRKRNGRGEWEAPIGELADELNLSSAQRKATETIFDQARNDTFALFSKKRADGSSLLDDVVKKLKEGKPPHQAWGGMFRRIFTEKVPDTDQTYLTALISMRKKVMTDLKEELDDEQMTKLKALRIDPLNVKTNYDPVKDYVTEQLKEK